MLIDQKAPDIISRNNVKVLGAVNNQVNVFTFGI